MTRLRIRSICWSDKVKEEQFVDVLETCDSLLDDFFSDIIELAQNRQLLGLREPSNPKLTNLELGQQLDKAIGDAKETKAKKVQYSHHDHHSEKFLFDKKTHDELNKLLKENKLCIRDDPELTEKKNKVKMLLAPVTDLCTEWDTIYSDGSTFPQKYLNFSEEDLNIDFQEISDAQDTEPNEAYSSSSSPKLRSADALGKSDVLLSSSSSHTAVSLCRCKKLPCDCCRSYHSTEKRSFDDENSLSMLSSPSPSDQEISSPPPHSDLETDQNITPSKIFPESSFVDFNGLGLFPDLLSSMDPNRILNQPPPNYSTGLKRSKPVLPSTAQRPVTGSSELSKSTDVDEVTCKKFKYVHQDEDLTDLKEALEVLASLERPPRAGEKYGSCSPAELSSGYGTGQSSRNSPDYSPTNYYETRFAIETNTHVDPNVVLPNSMPRPIPGDRPPINKVGGESSTGEKAPLVGSSGPQSTGIRGPQQPIGNRNQGRIPEVITLDDAEIIPIIDTKPTMAKRSVNPIVKKVIFKIRPAEVVSTVGNNSRKRKLWDTSDSNIVDNSRNKHIKLMTAATPNRPPRQLTSSLPEGIRTKSGLLVHLAKPRVNKVFIPSAVQSTASRNVLKPTICENPKLTADLYSGFNSLTGPIKQEVTPPQPLTPHNENISTFNTISVYSNSSPFQNSVPTASPLNSLPGNYFSNALRGYKSGNNRNTNTVYPYPNENSINSQANSTARKRGRKPKCAVVAANPITSSASGPSTSVSSSLGQSTSFTTPSVPIISVSRASLSRTSGIKVLLPSTSGIKVSVPSTSGTMASLPSTSGTMASLPSTSGIRVSPQRTSGIRVLLPSTRDSFQSTSGTMASLPSTSGTSTSVQLSTDPIISNAAIAQFRKPQASTSTAAQTGAAARPTARRRRPANMDPAKREAHNTAERQRRKLMTIAFGVVRQTLIRIEPLSAQKYPKVQILITCVSWFTEWYGKVIQTCNSSKDIFCNNYSQFVKARRAKKIAKLNVRRRFKNNFRKQKQLSARALRNALLEARKLRRRQMKK